MVIIGAPTVCSKRGAFKTIREHMIGDHVKAVFF